MKTAPNNPNDNKLPSSVTEELLQAAIQVSGYPLQSVVAAMLRPNFLVREEWGYVDSDSQKPRNLDIRADKPLYDTSANPALTVLPYLTFLAECKHSDQTHLFFLSDSKPDVASFPLIAGIPRDPLIIVLDSEGRTTRDIPSRTLLDLYSHPFITQEVPYAIAMTRGSLRDSGKRIEFSNDDFFNQLVLPLLKAAAYTKQSATPKSGTTFTNYICRLIVPVAVIDGPMVVVQMGAGGNELTLMPWIRVLRHDAQSLFAIDVVHRGFLQTYISGSLLPFAFEFAARVQRHQTELSSGKGRLRPLPSAIGTPTLSDDETPFESRLLPF